MARKAAKRVGSRSAPPDPASSSGSSSGSSEDANTPAAIRRREEMYRAVMGSMRPHIAVLDREGEIKVVNESWKRFALENGAHSLEGLGIGANYLDICRKAADQVEDASRVLEGLQAMLRDSSGELKLEYACHSPDQQRWFLLTATPWRQDGGGAVVTHTDITERVLAEQKLKESEEHYRALIENEVDVLTILKLDGTIVFESPALQRILGYQPHELVGKNAFEFIRASDAPAVRQAIAGVLQTNEPSKPVEFRFRHKDGSWRALESVARNLLSNPAVKGIIVNSRDVTERLEAQAELRRKEAALQSSHEQLQALTGRLLETEERERRRLSRELHDDLNQKLAILAFDIGALWSAAPKTPPRDMRKALRRVQAQVVQVSEEVRTMAYRLHPSALDDLGLPVALRSYCSEFEERERIRVRFVHRNLHANVSQEVATCLYRITQEGLRNVAKHSNASHAWVSLIGVGDFVRLTIRDAGEGFAADPRKGRRGLGLISMTERARLIGGEFRIESSPGKGTKLIVLVPWEAGYQ